MAELHVDEPLDEGYWESLGMEGDQARPSDPFSAPPPGAGQNPFEGHAGPTGRARYQAQWLKTRKGVEFIDVFIGDNEHVYVFLYPVQNNLWHVGESPSKPTPEDRGSWLHRAKPYEEAKNLAAWEAETMSADAGANAEWRQNIPGERQLVLADKLRIEQDGHETKGEISDKLNEFFASKVLDPTFAPKTRT